MRYLIFIFAFFATSAHALCSGTSFNERLSVADKAEIAAAVAKTPFGQGITWQATKGDKIVRFIGTMHISDPRLAAVFDEVVGLIFSSELLLVEATAVEEAQLQETFASNPDLIFINEGPTLPEILDGPTWDAVITAASARSIPSFMAAKMRPWYLNLALAIPPCAMAELIAGARGLDHQLIATAEVAQIPVQPLEPFDTLIDFMQRGSEADQIEALQLSLLAPELQSEMFVAMLDAYFTEDIAEIWETSRVSAKFVEGLDPEEAVTLFAEVERYLLVERNIAWIPVIEDALTTRRDVTVAVGAAHLPGEFGVLKLMENAGWTIQRLQF